MVPISPEGCSICWSKFAPLTNLDAGGSTFWGFLMSFWVGFHQLFNAFFGEVEKVSRKQVEVWQIVLNFFRSFIFSGWVFYDFSCSTRHVIDLKWYLWWVWKISRCEGNEIVKEMQRGKASFATINLQTWFQRAEIRLPERKKGRHTVLHRICVVLARTLLRLWQCRGVGHPSVWKPTGQKLPKPGCEKMDFSLGRNNLLNFKWVVTRASSFGSFFGGAYVTTLGSRYSENACHV